MTKQMVKSGGALARTGGAFSDEQRQIVRDSLANGATDQEFTVLWEMAKARNLDPMKREVFFVKRYDKQKQRDVWSVQVSIDGLRLQAARTGEYDGQDDTEFEYDKEGKPKLARTKVYRKGITRPFIGVAHWDEFVQRDKEGRVTSMWANKPHVMLGKCSESLAIRKAFPDETAGLYTTDEMPEPPKVQVEIQPMRKALDVPDPIIPEVIDTPVIEPPAPAVGGEPSEEEIKYLEFDTRIGAAEWGKEMETIRTDMKAFYERIGKAIPAALISTWKAKRKEVP